MTEVLGLFVAAPWLALLPGLVFGLLYWRTRRRAVLVSAAAWLVYALYEEGVRRRILCSGECNIRADLLLFYPVLAVLSLAALVSAARRASDKREARHADRG
jgi:hypothetical protein